MFRIYIYLNRNRESVSYPLRRRTNCASDSIRIVFRRKKKKNVGNTAKEHNNVKNKNKIQTIEMILLHGIAIKTTL